ncbi:MAG: PQQ-like beta-propeller repeat protein [Candidatus Kapabacteria bacterium]|nr:PQQ-like beta-propeller repeat protein [Candidatus Kapabacteria bacterium]
MLLLASCWTACQQARPTGAFNFYGGATRANAYEDAVSFTDAMLITDFPRPNDSLAPSKAMMDVGSNMPPIPISFVASYLTLLDGSAVRFAGGRIEWQAFFDSIAPGKRALAAALPCTDASDNLYVLASDGGLYSIDKNGKRRWKLALFTPSSTTLYCDLLLQPSGIVVGWSVDGTHGTLAKCSFDGTILWKRHHSLAPTRTFAADERQNLIVALSANTAGITDSLVCIAPNGEQVWSRGIAHTRLFRTPVVASGIILITGIREHQNQRDDVVYALDVNGQPRWEKVLSFTPQGIAVGTQESGTPLVVVAGYRTGIGEALSVVVGLDIEAHELWRLHYDMAVIGAPMISRNNIVLIGTKGEASGAYFMNKQGVFQRVVSLSNVAVCLIPAVDAENNIVFAATEALGIVKVGKLPTQRLLPY